MAVQVALLRGINVGGSTKIAMADLRAAAADLGWRGVETYIQSGNLIFQAEGARAELESALERALEAKLGWSVPVIVRSADVWAAYLIGNPFPEAAASEPNRLMLLLSKSDPLPHAAEALQERASEGERAAIAAGALWIHYAGGAGRSKLTPSLIDRTVGSPATARNWRTVLKLGEMLGPHRPSPSGAADPLDHLAGPVADGAG